MLKISIPEPCHEDWSRMSPNEQGRHCNSCAKTVVDFTAMSDDEVKNFFINKKEERVCGRFQQKQLDQIVIDLPHNIFSIEMPLWKKFLVASLVVFSTTLFSCNTSIDGQLVQNGQALEQLKNISNQPDHRSHATVGTLEVNAVPDTAQIPPPTCNTVKGAIAFPPIIKQPEHEHLVGDVAMIPDTSKPKKCEQPLMGIPVLELLNKDSVVHLMGKPALNTIKDETIVGGLKIKDPPKADQKDCDEKNYQ